jgi:hypothetical protein
VHAAFPAGRVEHDPFDELRQRRAPFLDCPTVALLSAFDHRSRLDGLEIVEPSLDLGVRRGVRQRGFDALALGS